ncbi:transposase [uncultured Shewanella sp.]|uniref:transposase n=1 Tax=uncultured Shewanella sp. TaxID=173975 RepID=UPI00261E1795|nr:transposase [uncultured Shewanella sp.]
MPRPRRTQISIEDTSYYHCCSRVVRRAYLCGEDPLTGKNYNHRRAWVENQLLKLSSIFAIDIAAYAVMSNHLHVVLYIDIEQANQWSDKEVVQQWHQLFKGSELTHQFVNGKVIEDYEVNTLKSLIAEYRSRLSDISWFMRCLNEPIARKANHEDKCTGHFWEGRFKSQALLDEAALLSCMAYVDLNPIRGKVAKTLQESNYTSIQQRINAAITGQQPNYLVPFVGNEYMNMPKGLRFNVQNYLQLVDETGRIISEGKGGVMSPSTMDILSCLNMSAENWLKLTNDFGRIFHGPVGTLQELTRYCEHLEKRRRHFSACCQYIC